MSLASSMYAIPLRGISLVQVRSLTSRAAVAALTALVISLVVSLSTKAQLQVPAPSVTAIIRRTTTLAPLKPLSSALANIIIFYK